MFLVRCSMVPGLNPSITPLFSGKMDSIRSVFNMNIPFDLRKKSVKKMTECSVKKEIKPHGT